MFESQPCSRSNTGRSTVLSAARAASGAKRIATSARLAPESALFGNDNGVSWQQQDVLGEILAVDEAVEVEGELGRGAGPAADHLDSRAARERVQPAGQSDRIEHAHVRLHLDGTLARDLADHVDELRPDARDDHGYDGRGDVFLQPLADLRLELQGRAARGLNVVDQRNRDLAVEPD